MSSDRQSNVTAGPPLVLDGAHPIPVGASVTIIRFGRSTPPYIEGRAVIKNAAQGRHCYQVQFLGDPVVRERVVHSLQLAPERLISIMLDLWRADNVSSPAVGEFFPDI